MKKFFWIGLFLITVQPALAKKESKGGLPQEIVDSTIKANLAAIRGCYENDLRENPAKGPVKVKTSFIINVEGRVTESKAEASVLHNEPMNLCILGELKKIKFPAPAGGGTVEVSYPFAFSPAVKP